MFVTPSRKSENQIVRKDDMRLLNRGDSVWNQDFLNQSTICNRQTHAAQRSYFDTRNKSISHPPNPKRARSQLAKALAPLQTHRLTAKQRHIQKRESNWTIDADQVALLNEYKPKGNRSYFGSQTPNLY